MNKYLFCVAIVFITIFNAPAQTILISSTNVPVNNSLSKLEFKTEVEWKVQNSIQTLNKNQAKTQLKKLINKYGKDNITRLHKVYAKDKNSYYSVVKFKSENEDLRLFYYCQKANQKYVVSKVRIYTH